ncbi:hypothetical protein [Nocardia jiangsuensis]|uniref:Uncharacterized protein n=1 Tax=Nocardia jiangsuensis TaxID=1691563 RepID=A0ABV8DZ09_9NOCA
MSMFPVLLMILGLPLLAVVASYLTVGATFWLEARRAAVRLPERPVGG